MVRILGLVICILFIQYTSLSQKQDLVEYNKKRLNIDNKLMLTLGSWSLANMAVSTYGWATQKNEAKYFHQMNTIWCAVNVGIAIPSFIRSLKDDPPSFSFAETYKSQTTTEKVFLFNAGVDVGYIASGFYLRSAAKEFPDQYHRFSGWGSSVILQGSFLLLFDLTAVIIHNHHRKNQLDHFLNRVELSDTGIGLKINLNQDYCNKTPSTFPLLDQKTSPFSSLSLQNTAK